jgi:hypothetical protein
MNSADELGGSALGNHGPMQGPVGGTAIPSPGRRRLFRGVAGGTGVLLAVQAKTALGQTACQSPSAIISGNTSPRPAQSTTCSGGLSPGFWKQPQKFGYWRNASPAKFNIGISACTSGLQGVTMDNIIDHGTLLTTIFGRNAPAGGMWAALAFPTSFGANGQLLRHLTAAWLNAQYFQSPSQLYPLTTDQVKEMWKDLTKSGVYCPNSLLNCGPTTGWSATQVINYISGMYDINSLPDPDLCKSL